MVQRSDSPLPLPRWPDAGLPIVLARTSLKADVRPTTQAASFIMLSKIEEYMRQAATAMALGSGGWLGLMPVSSSLEPKKDKVVAACCIFDFSKVLSSNLGYEKSFGLRYLDCQYDDCAHACVWPIRSDARTCGPFLSDQNAETRLQQHLHEAFLVDVP